MNGMALRLYQFGSARAPGLSRSACCLYCNYELVTPRSVIMKRPREVCLEYEARH